MRITPPWRATPGRHAVATKFMPTIHPPPDRPALRKLLRQRRRAISPVGQRLAALRLAARVCTLPVFIQGKNIALYIARDGEIDPRTILEWCQRRGKKCYAPVLAADPACRQLRFQRFTGYAQTRENRFRIAEPAAGELLRAADLDLVLLPLVGFDARGNRLGMGGGFYDATFAREPIRRRPPLIGLAHECQQVPHLHTFNWDIPLNCIVTDRRVYYMK